MKYLIMFDAGYGETYDEIDADSLDEADQIAYDCWRDEAESGANYWAKPMTDKLREDYLE